MPENILTYNGISIPEEDVYGLPVRLYHHIFYGRVSQNYRIYGVHHKEALTEKTKDFETGDLTIEPKSILEKGNGFYEASVACWNGDSWVRKSTKNGFFPDNWNRKMVMEEIATAKEQLTIDDWLPPVSPQKKSNAFVTKLPCGQAIVFYLGSPKRNRPSRPDRYIVTVFPYFTE